MTFSLAPTVRQITRSGTLNAHVTASGWVRSLRVQKSIAFIDLSDGTDQTGLQVTVQPDSVHGISTGAAIRVEGILQKSQGDEQSIELKATQMHVIGECDAKSYPIQKKRHSVEFLRQICHLRPRSNTTGAVIRTRNELVHGVHDFFRSLDFVHVHTPILTSADCEGGGEVFVVQPQNLPEQLLRTSAENKDNQTDANNREFFGHPAFLTVSSQLHLEMFANAMPRVYTLSPVFRAETSLTTRHLSEFYMLEAEMAFTSSLKTLCELAENCVQRVATHVLQQCEDDMIFFNTRIRKDVLTQTEALTTRSFEIMEYTKAIEILQKHQHIFEFPVKWGYPLQSEHEKYLADVVCQGPVFIIRYPIGIKPFYMLKSETVQDNPLGECTVENFDLLLPRVGELAGGSLREHRISQLTQQMTNAKIDMTSYQWYLDSRRYGNAPHGGFGLGLDRLLMYMCGLDSVRDVVLIPRYFKECRC